MLRRLVVMGVTWVLVSVALFSLLGAMPGDATDRLIAEDPRITAADVARLRALSGADRPAVERYACWLFGRRDGPGGRCAYWPGRGILFGDLGYSKTHNAPVTELLGTRLSNTLRLMLPALSLALLVALTFGLLAAGSVGRPIDRIVSGASILGVALPAHWLGLMAILVFAVALGWFPAGGVEPPTAPGAGARIYHAVLPVGVLALYFAGRWTRHVRAAAVRGYDADFAQLARAKGLSPLQVTLRHVLPAALVPIVAVVAQSMPALFSGALVTERVFSYPGMGLLIFECVVGSDHVVAMTVFMIFAALTMLATLLADIAYAWIDPRIELRDVV